MRDESSTATSDSDKANVLNEFFASCFNPTSVPPSYPHPEALDNICPDSYDIVSNEVANLLKKPNPTLHLARMAFQPGCSGPLPTQSHPQLPPCSISLSPTGSCQLSGSSPILFQSLKDHPDRMFASTDLSLFCPPSANAWKDISIGSS